MTTSAYPRWAMLASLAVACALPAAAGSTLEGMKAESGLRFSESSGLGPARTEAEPVWAGKESGRRANLTVVTPQPGRKPDAPPSPTPPAPKGSGLSLGGKLAVAAGAVAGAFAGASLAAVYGGVPLVLLALGGAATAAAGSFSKGDRGWELAKKTALGAVLGASALVFIGAAAGFAVGRGLERLFKR